MPALIAHSQFHLIVLYVALFACFAPEWIGTFLQRPEPGTMTRDRGSHVVLIAASFVGIFLGFWFATGGLPRTTIGWRQPLLFWVGIALMACGVAFRWYAIRVLGRFFTRSVATRAGQYVVDTGPYRLIRHPSYSGSMITLLGMALAMTNWASVAVVLLCALIGYGCRVRVEEHVLCADLGEPYRNYMQRTWRFIPYVW